MTTRTIFLSRLIGMYCILLSIPMALHKKATVEMVTALLGNPPLLFTLGALLVIGGLAVILAHNVWSGGALPVAVTVLGWATLIKGMMFLLLSSEDAAALYLGAFHYDQLFYMYAAISFLMGVSLTFAAASRPARNSGRSAVSATEATTVVVRM